MPILTRFEMNVHHKVLHLLALTLNPSPKWRGTSPLDDSPSPSAAFGRGGRGVRAKQWSTLFVLILLLCTGNIFAQDAAEELIAQELAYGDTVSGRLDNRNPRETFIFEGLRGEYITIRLRSTSGNLDPVLAVLDDRGAILIYRDDADGGADVTVNQIPLPRSTTYTLVIGRFGYNQGSTTGEYELNIERIGVSAESGSALRFGDTVANTITETEPQIFYSFRALRGDIVTLTMRRDSGTLDPFLQVVNARRQILAANDDMPESNNARIERLIIEEDGQYLIIASRYGEAAGQTTGSFLLTLERDDGSGLGGSPEVAIRLEPGVSDRRELTVDRFQLYYVFEARRDDLVTIRMNRASGSLDPLLVMTNAGLQELIVNDDIVEGENRNALIESYRIPADGQYYVIATRFERDAGTSIGEFTIELSEQVNVFSEVSGEVLRIGYGTTAIGTLTNAQPDLLYAFYGNAEDTITLSARQNAGDLIPTLAILDSEQQPLRETPPVGPDAAIDRFTLPRTGIYYVRVSRAAGTGDYILVLAQIFD